jgi:branched-chain amino acid transport system substrate-binding protein
MRNIFTVIIGILIIVINSPAQDLLARERELLYKNIDLYKTGRYEKAIQNFTLMIERLPDSPFLTTNYLMKAKSEYKDAQYTSSLQSAKSFVDKFPQSRYRDEIYYLMGSDYYKLNRYGTAINAWDKSLSITNNDRLLERLSYLITRTAQYRLTKSDISELQTQDLSADCQVLLVIAEAENLVANRNRYKAQILIEQTLAAYPKTRFKDKAKMLLESGQSNDQDEMKIALLLPLSGYNAEIGEAIRAGADFAMREYNQTASHPLKLIVKDYGEDITTALRFYKEISQRNDVLAMFGPIENEIVSACAALSDYEHLPIISPTATDNDLTTLTDYFFQINSTLEMRAEMLANYAIDSLGIKRFATFSPIENHFAQMVDEFTHTLKARSAKVVTQQWYYPSDQDMHKQFMNIKRIGLWYAFADSLRLLDPLIDSLKIDSLYRIYKKNEDDRLKEAETKIDSADIAVSSIDGIFIPIYKEDIKFIAPQIAYSNIQSHYLGNGDWYNPEELKKNKNYINGLVFISDGFLDEENWDYRNFRNKYRESLNLTPNTYNLIGYDCMRFMLKPFEKGNTILNRDEYSSRLKQIGRFDGLYRRILLDDQNRNTALRILRFNYGQIIPVN